MLKAFSEALLSEGPLGVIIAGMGFWIWKQRHDGLALQAQLNSVQERRVQDAMKLADAAHTFANALDRNTEALKAFVLEE